MKKNPFFILLLSPAFLFAQTPIVDVTLSSESSSAGVEFTGIQFEDGAAYSAGKYQENLINVFRQDFDMEHFTISVQFKVENTANMPVFVMGASCRFAAFYLLDNGRVGLHLNNTDIRLDSEISYKAGTWHTATLTYDDQKKVFNAYLDGKLAVTTNTSIHWECYEKYYGKDLSTTNFGNGQTFKGWLKNLKIYNNVVVPKGGGQPLPQPLPNPNPQPQPQPIPNPNPNPQPITGSLKDRISTTDISTAPYYPTDISRYGASAYYAGYDDDSQHFLAWNARTNNDNLQKTEGIRITPLNNKMERTGQDIVLKDYVVEDILAVEKGYLTLLVSEVKNNTYIEYYPNQLSIMKIDMSGKVIFKTILAGNEGQGPNKHWMDYNPTITQFVFNGTHYGIWFEVKKNWAEKEGEEDVHNGDKFMVVDKQGAIVPDRTVFWGASHSNLLKIITNDKGDFITGTVGDAYPFGIQVKNQTQKITKIVFPAEHLRTKEIIDKVDVVTGAGVLGGMLYKNNKIYLFLGALETMPIPFNQAVDPLLLILNEQNEVITQKWLIKGTTADESYTSCAHFGNNILVEIHDANANFNGSSLLHEARLAVIDENGNFVQQLTSTEQPTHYRSPLFNFPNGDAGWVVADKQSIKVIRVKKT